MFGDADDINNTQHGKMVGWEQPNYPEPKSLASTNEIDIDD